jgi:acetyl-CoA carboxylase biotin carboxyl carrier protein
MNIKEVKDLIHEVLQSDICEFELEHTGTKVRLKRTTSDPAVLQVAQAGSAGPNQSSSPAHIEPASAQAVAKDEAREENWHLISSPIVGTFYRSPSPGAEPFVKIGDMVEEGTVLCIIEAMKLMNEIPSDISGEIVRTYVENGNPVEFGQSLFGILPRK